MRRRRVDYAVILAAGMGTRLAAVNANRPKALFPVRGRTLFDYACDFAEAVAEQRIVVGGFGYEQLEQFVGDSRRSRLQLVAASDYRHGNIVSLLAAVPLLDGATLIMNVDHVYADEVRTLVAAPRDQITIFCDGQRALTDDDMKVAVDARGSVRSISKQLDRYDTGYVGLTYVPRSQMTRYRSAVMQTFATKGKQAAAESVIQTLADDGVLIPVCELDGLKWAEVDTPIDAEELSRRSDLWR